MTTLVIFLMISIAANFGAAVWLTRVDARHYRELRQARLESRDLFRACIRLRPLAESYEELFEAAQKLVSLVFARERRTAERDAHALVALAELRRLVVEAHAERQRAAEAGTN